MQPVFLFTPSPGKSEMFKFGDYIFPCSPRLEPDHMVGITCFPSSNVRR